MILLVEIYCVAPATCFKYNKITGTQRIQVHKRYKYTFIHKHTKENQNSFIQIRAPCAQVMSPGQEFQYTPFQAYELGKLHLSCFNK